MNELKKMKNYFNPYNLQKEIGGYGYDFDISKFIITLIVIPTLSIVIGRILELQWIYIFVIIAVFLCCIPDILLLNYKYLYEQRRFSEINSYIEQMIYSFKKKDKIISCLEDVRQLANNNMARVIDKAMENIMHGETRKDIYRESLDIIEKEYNCSRIKTLHSFLIEIEENGGEYQHSLTILLDDIQQWAKRIRLLQQTRKGIQAKVLLSIVLAMGTCSAMLFMIPQEYVSMITDKSIYQICTTFILIACILLYVYTNKKLTSSYLDDDDDLMKTDEFKKCYEVATKFNVKEGRKNNIKKIIAMIICAGVLYFVDDYIPNVSLILPAVMFLFLGVFFLYQPNFKKNNAIKKTVREIEKVFPIWIRTLVLHLQTNNVTVALYNSISTVPSALYHEVAKLVNGIYKKPNEITPYLKFMEDFEGCHDLKTSVKHLYALSEFGADDLVRQLDYLIQQNQELMEHSEQMRNEDKMAGLSTLILAPMLLSIAKLVVDLWLFSSSFMTMMGNAGNIGL